MGWRIDDLMHPYKLHFLLKKLKSTEHANLNLSHLNKWEKGIWYHFLPPICPFSHSCLSTLAFCNSLECAYSQWKHDNCYLCVGNVSVHINTGVRLDTITSAILSFSRTHSRFSHNRSFHFLTPTKWYFEILTSWVFHQQRLQTMS